MVRSKSCLQGVAQSSQQEGEILSVPRSQLLGMVLSTSCKKRISPKAAEILWRQRTKEIPAAGWRECRLGTRLAFQETASLRVDCLQEFFLLPVSCSLCFGCCIPVFAWAKFPPPQPLVSAVPNPGSSPWCPCARAELRCLTGNVISSSFPPEIQEAVGWDTAGMTTSLNLSKAGWERGPC